MRFEDGDCLPIEVTFREPGGEYWHCSLAALPRQGDGVYIASAPKGTKHVVHNITHHVGGASHRIEIDVVRSGESPRKLHIAWNETKTVGIVCEDGQLAYELRKGALNSLGIVTGAFVEAWADMTVDDNCTTEEVELPR